MLSIIVPCYNEADAIPYFFAATEEVITGLGCQTEYIFVNDGSKDETLTVLRNLHQEHPDRVRYLSFSRNFGKEAAIFAGLKACRGDYITLMDADLQDPPELLPQMFELIQSKEVDCVGIDIVQNRNAQFFGEAGQQEIEVRIIDENEQLG